MVAAGGRYDSLLRQVWSASASVAGSHPSAAGLTINLEKLIRHLGGIKKGGERTGKNHGGSMERAQGSSALVPCSQSDVLICSKGEGLLEARMKLDFSLRSAGVRSEIFPGLSPSLQEQYEWANSRTLKWLVILEQAPEEPSGVKATLKNLGPARKAKGEASVALPLANIVAYLSFALLGTTYTSPADTPATSGVPSSPLPSAQRENREAANGPAGSLGQGNERLRERQMYHRL